MSYVDAQFDRDQDVIRVVERKEGKRHFTEYPVKYTFYYKDQRGKYKSIYGDPLNRIVARNTKQFRKELAINQNKELEYLRNWHWMWSKFYFNKKHYGFYRAIIKIFYNLISACFKFFIYSIIFNSHKKKIYKMRLCGIYSSVLGKKSSYRIDN